MWKCISDSEILWWVKCIFLQPSTLIIIAISPKYKEDVEGFGVDSHSLHTRYIYAMVSATQDRINVNFREKNACDNQTLNLTFPDAEWIYPTRQFEFQIHPSAVPEHIPGHFHIILPDFFFSSFHSIWLLNIFYKLNLLTQKDVPTWLQNTRVYRWPLDTEDLLLRLLREEKYIPPPVPVELTLLIKPVFSSSAAGLWRRSCVCACVCYDSRTIVISLLSLKFWVWITFKKKKKAQRHDLLHNPAVAWKLSHQTLTFRTSLTVKSDISDLVVFSDRSQQRCEELLCLLTVYQLPLWSILMT